MASVKPLCVLLVEDRAADAELMLDRLRQAGFEPLWQRVSTESEYLSHLNSDLELILSDHKLRQFTAKRALALLQERGLDVPFIIVSSTNDEEAAVEAMKQGATDYLRKERLTRLGEAVKQALRKKMSRDARRRAEIARRDVIDRMLALLTNGSDIIVIIDTDGTMKHVSRSVERILGYSPEELVGQDVFDYVYSADQQKARSIQYALLSSKGITKPRKIRLRHKDNSIRMFEVVSGNLLDNQAVRGILINLREIVEPTTSQAPPEQEEYLKQLQLARRLVETQEAERRRIAQDLHDQIGLNLSVLSINLSVFRSHFSGLKSKRAEALSLLQDSFEIIDETVEHIHEVIAELRPAILDDYHLAAALRWYGEQFTKRTGISVTMNSEDLAEQLPPDTEVALFRIAQESLTNVAKHAHATHAMVSLEQVGKIVRLTIVDDGVGFDVKGLDGSGERQGFGLINMRERAEAVAGRMYIESAPGVGTRIRVEVAR